MANIVEYLQDTYHELVHKVSWPTWTELQNNTIMVVVGSVIFSLLIFVMDFIFGINPSTYFWKGVLGLIYP
ncbi:preprotein translocase subunit SecE [Brumimicrobium mesophilum]|uniref:preprotein translocase subunit SecE n=1 Tax=Brumimicrobium mesophilum TaxID=392717 RepID=UPI000D1409F6|nr:preprotein translocase subunit SecE [Brumimicrobium mesophilum]